MKKMKPKSFKRKKIVSLWELQGVNPEHYLNRELSWLEFNLRVLSQAQDITVPLFERLLFCSIFISNLDEFFMKRVGGLKNQIEYHYTHRSMDGKTPQEQLSKIRKKIQEQFQVLDHVFKKDLLPALKKENIFFLKWQDLNSMEKKKLTDIFKHNIFPILTPLAVDYSHPFPFISNLSKSLGICMKNPRKGEKLFARVKIPTELPQWIRIPSPKGVYRFINIEEIIKHNIEMLYPGMQILAKCLFRVTRNAGMEEDDEEDAEDVLALVEEGLKERKFSPVLRLEHESSPDAWILDYLCQELELGKEDLYEMSSVVHYSSFRDLYEKVDRPYLKFKPWAPKVPLDFADESVSLFSQIRKKEYLIHHPYESFSATVERFIQGAAFDPHVLAIKLTLYRTDSASKIIDSLVYAAESGKQVACVIEVKARFEEEKNLRWAEKLENAGVHVVYGVMGLKTHSKMMLIVRRDQDRIKSYAHIGTGNYNSQTSKIYTDFSFFTSDPAICAEAVEVFNFLTGMSLKKTYTELLVAPVTMKKSFLELIENEIKYKKAGLIIAKMNSLEDSEMIEALYKASGAGVKIYLIVRGICCLRPGLKDLSENIRVISIVGRFLEHSRVFYFSGGHKDPLQGSFYIASADWMYRNLNNRVEVAVPIKAPLLRKKLWDFLQIELQDHALAWEMDARGKWIRRQPKNTKEETNSHLLLMGLSKNLL